MARMAVDERRAKLVEAAITVMSREGLAQATTRSITAEAGMQVGAFHYCFFSKEELILEVLKALSDRSFGAVETVLQDRPAQGADIVEATVAAYVDHVVAHPLDLLLSFELMQHAARQHQHHEQIALAIYGKYFARTEELLEAMAAAGGFGWRVPVDALARFTLAIVEGATLQWAVVRDERHARALFAELCRYLRSQVDAGVLTRGGPGRPPSRARSGPEPPSGSAPPPV